MCSLVGISSQRMPRPRYYLQGGRCSGHGNRAWRRDDRLAANDRHRARHCVRHRTRHGAAYFALAGVLSRDGTTHGSNDCCESSGA